MAVDTANEPAKKVFDLITARAHSDLDGRISYGAPADVEVDSLATTPKLTWRAIGVEGGDTDVENMQSGNDLIQIDIWGTDVDQLRSIAFGLEQMEADCWTTADTTHWTYNSMRQIGAWQQVRQNQLIERDGNELLQLTSTWRFRYQRLQNVA